MRVLLDTHALIWALEGSPRLSKAALRVIESVDNEVLVSAVSAWEMAVKKSLGKLTVPDNLKQTIDEAGFIRKSIGFDEANQLETLPWLHRDPFDRMLVAQALVEGVPLVTCDEAISQYPIQVIW